MAERNRRTSGANGSRRRSRSPSDEVLAEARAHGFTFAVIAAEHGGSERNARRRCAEPAMRRRIAERRGEIAAEAVGALGVAVPAAIDALVGGLRDLESVVRLRSSLAVLSQFGRLRDHLDVEAEIVALREQLADLRLRVEGGDIA